MTCLASLSPDSTRCCRAGLSIQNAFLQVFHLLQLDMGFEGQWNENVR